MTKKLYLLFFSFQSMFQLADIDSVYITDPVKQQAEEVDITNWIETEFPPITKQEDLWLSDFGWAFGEPSSQGSNSTTKEATEPLIKKGEELGNLQAAQTMHEGRMEGLVKEEIDPASNFHALNEFGVNKSLKLVSCTTSVATMHLEFLTMAQLRAMANARNLKRYSKLNKSGLIKLLEESL